MVVVGGRIPRDAPDDVGGAPRQAGRGAEILRHGEDRERPADRFAGGCLKQQPFPDQCADSFADFHRGDPFGREVGFECAVDGLAVEVDQPDRVAGECKPGLRRFDVLGKGGGLHRGVGPAIEGGVLADPEGKAAADAFERSCVVHQPQVAARAGACKRTSTSATAIAAAPSQSSGVSASR